MSKYSVVIPMYNNSDTIVETLASVIKQTRYDLIDEIIIVNDGSTDDSVQVVEKFMKEENCAKIHLLSKKNGGAASARNKGIREAKNDWIALLDGDDSWYVDKIEKQDAVLEKNSQILALGTNRDGEVIQHGTKISEGIYHLTPLQYCIKNWPCTPSLIFHKSIFEDENYFDESLSHAEEGIFYLDIAAKSGLYYMAEPLVLCGNGKPAYGHSGLSGNVKKMHLGVLQVMKMAYQKHYLTVVQYLCMCIYEEIKYMRRKVILSLRKRGK